MAETVKKGETAMYSSLKSGLSLDTLRWISWVKRFQHLTPGSRKEQVKGGEEVRMIVLPVYDTPQLAYVQDCLIKAVQATAKNRAKSDNAEIAFTWTDLLTAAEGAKFGTIFKLFKDTFTEWLAEHSGYTDTQCAQIIGVMDIRKLQGMRFDDRQKIAHVLQRFTEALEDTSDIQSALNALTSVLNKQDEDFGFLS